MAKYCSDCDYLNTKKNKGDGIYECKKNKKFVLANMPACDKFANCYNRKYFDKQRLYDLGKEASEKSSDVTGYLIGYIVLLVLAIIAWFLGY